MKHRLSILLFCVILMLGSAFAQQIPKPDGYINDFAGVLDQTTEVLLTAKARQLKADKNIELGVVVITSAGGRDIAEFGTQLAREWGVGAKDGERRGLLLVVATNDRKSNIQVSRHLEGDFTDARTGEILRGGRDDFKAGRFGDAIIKITDGIVARANSVAAEDKNAAPAQAKRGWNIGLISLLLAIVGFGAIGVLYPVFRELLSLRKKPQSETTDSDIMRAGHESASGASSCWTSPPDSSSNSPGSASSSDAHSSLSFGGGADFGGGGASDSW